jgi:hypothetical protein
MRSITKTNRMSTMIIDHFMMAFLLMLFEAPFMVHNLLTLSSLDNGQCLNFFSDITGMMYFFFLFILIRICCKAEAWQNEFLNFRLWISKLINRQIQSSA